MKESSSGTDVLRPVHAGIYFSIFLRVVYTVLYTQTSLLKAILRVIAMISEVLFGLFQNIDGLKLFKLHAGLPVLKLSACADR